MTLAGRLLLTLLTHFKLKKTVFHNPIKCYKLIKVLMLARSSKKKLSNLQNVSSQMRAYRSVFGKHDLLPIEHNVDLELTLPFLLGPVPWSLSILDRYPTKTDKSKLPHGLQSHIGPTLYWQCSAAHNVDVNAVTTEQISFSCHLHGSYGTSIQSGNKSRVCWFCH